MQASRRPTTRPPTCQELNNNTRLHYQSVKELKENAPANRASTADIRATRSRAETVKSGVAKDSAIISKQELEDIRAAAVILSKEDKVAQHKLQQD